MMPNHGQALRTLTLLLSQVLVPGAALAASVVAPAAELGTDAMPALMLPRMWPSGHSPAGFLVSEKFDGVRAFWDGQRLRFRSGRPIAAPDWFTETLPKLALDGELWLAHGQFDRLSATVRRSQPVDQQWRKVHYLVFDLPGATGTFSERVQRLAEVVQTTGQPWLQLVTQQRIDGVAALQTQLKRVVALGGEGLVLHRANALWAPGRSDALLKFKPMPDEDARVVAHLPGKGRHAGRLGALMLELPDGQRFALGTGFTDAQRASPPAMGSLVTYRYRDRTLKGLPRFASFLRVREAE